MPHFLVNMIELAVMLAPIGVVVWLLWRIRSIKKRQRERRCPNCGYQIRGQAGTHCPECSKSTQWEHVTEFTPTGAEGSLQQPPGLERVGCLEIPNGPDR